MSVPYLGDYAEDATVYMPFNTFTSDDPQASSTITNLADSDLHVHKDGSATEIVTDGATITINFDSITGNHVATIDTSAHADYAIGSDYMVRMEGTTVDGATINAWIGHFSIENRFNEVNVTAISGDSGAADNLEATYDGNGYSDDNAPAKQSQLAQLANVGAAVHKSALSYTANDLPSSAPTITNTYTATEPLDGTYHQFVGITTLSGAGEEFDIEYEFNVGGGSPTSIQLIGYLTGPNDRLRVFGWDYSKGSPDWVQVGAMQGSASTTNQTFNYDLFVGMVGVGANKGKVRFRLYNDGGPTDTVLSSADLYIDQLYVSFNEDSSGYEDAAIWYDDDASNANTVPNIDGVAGNPVSTEAAVETLLTDLNYHRVQVAPGSTYTLASTHDKRIINGHGATIELGAQSCIDTHFFDGSISGTATASSGEMEFHRMEFDSASSVQVAHHYDCTFSSTNTLSLAGDYHFHNCQSGVAGAGSPTFAFAAAAITAEFRRWSGGITFSGLTSDDTLTISGELGTINLGSPGSAVTVEIRGTYKEITNVGSASVNLDGAIKASDVATILADTNETQGKLPTNKFMGSSDGADDDGTLNELTSQGDTNETKIDTVNTDLANGTDGLGALKTLIDTVNTDLANGTDGLGALKTLLDTVNTDLSNGTDGLGALKTLIDAIDVIVDVLRLGIIVGTAATGTLSTTQCTSSLTGYTDDQIIGRIITFTSGPADGESSDITDYVDTDGLITFTAMTLASENGNAFKIT